MTRAQCWFVHTSNLLVGGTGVVYGWMRYFAESEDEFALVNHPWQPEWRQAHLLSAPLLVFACGLIWQAHVWANYRRGTRRGRRTGITLLATLAPMVFSGYALQVSSSQSWMSAWMWLHIVTSSLWVFFAAIHPFLPPARPARRQDDAPRFSDAQE